MLLVVKISVYLSFLKKKNNIYDTHIGLTKRNI